MTSNNYQNTMPFLKTWFIATRPFSFAASAIPVVFGSLLAVFYGGAELYIWRVVLSLIGILSLHAAANIYNDVCDYKRGLDREVNPGSGAVVRQLLSPRAALYGASLFLFVGSCIGFWLTYLAGYSVLILGVLGVFIGFVYSSTKRGLKYLALGDFAIFISFGILISLGGWVVQTGIFAWLPVVWILPYSFLVTAILHANNWRDSEHDKVGNCKTMANLLGDSGSYTYYKFLIIAPYVLVVSMFIISFLLPYGIMLQWEKMPAPFLLTMLSLPCAIKPLRVAKERKSENGRIQFAGLDSDTAQLSLVFGVLSIVGICC